MPLYDYDCAACGRRFEVIHGVNADPPTSCPLCGSGPVRKAFAAPAIHFKGSGWAKKERRASVSSGSSADGDASEVASGSGAGGKTAGERGSDRSGEGESRSGGGDSSSGGGDSSSTKSPKTGSSASKTSGSDGD